MRLTRGIFIPLLLALPIVSASSADGLFSAREDITLRDDVSLAGEALAFFSDTDADLQGLRMESPRVVVHAYQEDRVRAGLFTVPPPFTPSQTVSNYTLTDVRIQLAAGNHRGWLGIYPQDMVASFRGTQGIVQSAWSSSLGNGYVDEAEPRPDYPGYIRETTGPHILVEGQGSVELRGTGFLKLDGADIEIVAKENGSAVLYRTGIEHTSGVNSAGTQTHRWLFLEFEDAVFGLEGDAPLHLATPVLQGAWSGEAHFAAASGSLEGDDVAYVSADAPASVWGEFTATFTPSSQEEGKMQVALAGDVLRTTLPPQDRAFAARVVGGAGSSAWLLGGVALASVLVGGSAVVLRRRMAGGAQSDLSVDELVDLANIAAEEQRFGAALEWVRRARALAPRNGRLATDEAFYLAALGEVDQALARYAEAAEFTEDGEPEFLAGALVLDAGGEVAEAEALMMSALARNPTYALELEDMPAARRLQGRPAFERAMSDARRRLA